MKISDFIRDRQILILGSTGMLGKALVKECKNRDYYFVEAAIDGKYSFDIKDDEQIIEMIGSIKPEVIINTVAIIDLMLCEKNPGMAYRVNTRPISIITELCKKHNIYFVQISTDHFFTGDGRKKHSENDKVILLNEYARTKYLAEALTLLYENSLVIRTNIVGFRGNFEQLTFVEWIITELQNNHQITLFEDYYTSSIDVTAFSKYLFDLINLKIKGVINLASNQVSSKKEFIEFFASEIGINLKDPIVKGVKTINGIKRAESLGLDVTKVEKILDCQMPNLQDVIKSLTLEYKERSKGG